MTSMTKQLSHVDAYIRILHMLSYIVATKAKRRLVRLKIIMLVFYGLLASIHSHK